MTIIEGNEGITVVDPLISQETAKVGMDLYYANRGQKPVKAVIYTHSHVDHYGGVRGVIDEADVQSGKVKIYAPEGFLEAAVAENVMAGNAMSRRASLHVRQPSAARRQGASRCRTRHHHLGRHRDADPADRHHLRDRPQGDDRRPDLRVSDGAGFRGAVGDAVVHRGEERHPAAEDATHTLHNTYSLRGAKIREPLKWSKYLNQALVMWGDKAEVMFAQHHWPTWDNKNVVELLKKQRDLYRYINDETLRLANSGLTMREIAEQIELPESLANFWANRGYYGSLYHDVAATYVLYLGWFDGNPATLHELPPVEASKNYVEFMGGADAVLGKARDSYAKGDFRWVAQVVNHVVFADPDNQDAKDLQADALEQLGYQAESGPWRNFYLTGAQELRKGVAQLPTPNTASPDTIGAMDLDLFFDFIAMRLNGPKAGNATAVLNFVFTDTGAKYMLELGNGVLNHTADHQADDPDATVTLARDTLNKIILQQIKPDDAISSGDVTVSGDQSKLKELVSYLDTFEFWFNIVTP